MQHYGQGKEPSSRKAHYREVAAAVGVMGVMAAGWVSGLWDKLGRCAAVWAAELSRLPMLPLT